MEIKYYVDKAGNYLGGFNDTPPKGAKEVPEPPGHGGQKWNGASWDAWVPSAEDVENLRLIAYADPVTGSDRFFAEAMREDLAGNSDAAEAARNAGIARYEDIKKTYPWPQ